MASHFLYPRRFCSTFTTFIYNLWESTKTIYIATYIPTMLQIDMYIHFHNSLRNEGELCDKQVNVQKESLKKTLRFPQAQEKCAMKMKEK